MRNEIYEVLADDGSTWGRNSNILLVGSSGSGKTTTYVKPSILLRNHESFIIADSKRSLCEELSPSLRENGYKILNVDFTDIRRSCGYNPLNFIRYDTDRQCYNEQDIMTAAACIIPPQSEKEPFWEMSARTYLESMIAYVLECCPKSEHNLSTVVALFYEMGTGKFKRLFQELREINPDSFAVSRYQLFSGSERAEKMYESIRAFIANAVSVFAFDGARKLATNPNQIDFAELGKSKTAVFINTSETDRSMDALASLFYTQAIHVLYDLADHNSNHKLEVPVRLYLDDFTSSGTIPEFSKIAATSRSRGLSLSVIIQSISQLDTAYGPSDARSIVQNFDTSIYLGGTDLETAKFFACRANVPLSKILNMALDKMWLFRRGSNPVFCEKYRMESEPHTEYSLEPAA